MKTTRPNMRHPHRPRYIVRATIAVIAAALGLADLVSALFPRLRWQPVLEAWPLAVHAHTSALTLVIDLFLVLLSYGLLHGKRQAWRISGSRLYWRHFCSISCTAAVCCPRWPPWGS